MSHIAAHGEQYTIHRALWAWGPTFRVHGADGTVKGFCRQKVFKLREDIRLYTDETCEKELFVITARKVIDFGATYDVFVGNDGPLLGSYRRHGMGSTFVRDTWDLLSVDGKVVATLTETRGLATMLRRWMEFVAFLSPQTYSLERPDGRTVARFRTHFNPFVRQLGVSIAPGHSHPDLPELLILAGGCLVAAIEGRR